MTTLSGYLKKFVFLTALAILPFAVNYAYGATQTSGSPENTLIADHGGHGGGHGGGHSGGHGGGSFHHGGGGSHWSGGGSHWSGSRHGGYYGHGDRGYYHHRDRDWDNWGGGWYWSYPYYYNNYYYRGYNYYPYNYYPDYYYYYNNPYYYDDGSGLYFQFGF